MTLIFNHISYNAKLEFLEGDNGEDRIVLNYHADDILNTILHIAFDKNQSEIIVNSAEENSLQRENVLRIVASQSLLHADIQCLELNQFVDEQQQREEAECLAEEQHQHGKSGSNTEEQRQCKEAKNLGDEQQQRENTERLAEGNRRSRTKYSPLIKSFSDGYGMKELIDVLPIGAVVSKQPLGNTTVGDFLSMNGDRLDAFCKLRKGNRSLFSLIKLQYEMRPQMCHLGFDGRIEYYDKDGIPQEDTSIENMQLSKRAHNCLYKSHYLYCSQLIGFKEEELLRISQLGKQTAQEIIDKVKQYTTCELLKPIEEMANVIQPIDDDEANINESTDDNLIETLDLSARAYNCLKRAGIDTIAQLAALSEDTLLHLKNMGAKSARETIAKLTHYREQQQGIPSSEQQAETRMEGAKPASATHAVQYLAKRIQDEGFTDVVRYEKSMDLTATAFVHTSSDGDFLPDRDGNALYIMFLSTLQVSNELQRAITEKLAAKPKKECLCR